MKLSIGTAQFGLDYGVNNKSGKLPKEEVKKILVLAELSDVRIIDTARIYGESEKVIGESKLDKFNIITKLPPINDSIINIENWMRDELRKSLNNLNQDRVYALLLHDSGDLLSKKSKIIYDVLDLLKKENKVSKIGISAYSPDDIKKIVNLYPIDIVQAPLNIFDRRMLLSGCLDDLKNLNIEFHARSCFLQGLLLVEYQNIPEQFSNWKELFKVWSDWLKENKYDALDVCLNYLSSLDGVDSVIVGVDSFKQFREILNIDITDSRYNFPDIFSMDESLINPKNWKEL